MKCLLTTCQESWCECAVCLMSQDTNLADEIKAKVPGHLPLPGRWSLVRPQPGAVRTVAGPGCPRLCVPTLHAPLSAHARWAGNRCARSFWFTRPLLRRGSLVAAGSGQAPGLATLASLYEADLFMSDLIVSWELRRPARFAGGPAAGSSGRLRARGWGGGAEAFPSRLKWLRLKYSRFQNNR